MNGDTQWQSSYIIIHHTIIMGYMCYNYYQEPCQVYDIFLSLNLFPFFSPKVLIKLNVFQIMYLIIGVYNTKTEPLKIEKHCWKCNTA